MRSIEAGQAIPEWSLPMTPTTIVSTAIATRDWQDVHHDRDVAQAAGSKDIFMNILTSNGLVEKYVADWLGHASPTVTLSTYAHLMPADEEVARGVLDDAFSNEVAIRAATAGT